MTEAEWLAGDDPFALVRCLKGNGNQRKWGLLAAACWRSYPPAAFARLGLQGLVDLTEARAEGLSEPDNMWADYECYVLGAAEVEMHAFACSWTDDLETAQRHQALHATLVREVFGNPFRTPRLDAAWRVPWVASLAGAAYTERDLPGGLLHPPRLGILADALEDAGCTDEVILTHLRHPGPHVRGCWALDLILGKQ